MVSDLAQPPSLSDLRRLIPPWSPRDAVAAALRLTPEPAPMAMPEQRLDVGPSAHADSPVRPDAASRLKRLVLFLGAFAFAGLNGLLLGHVLSADGRIGPLEAATLALSVLLSAWLAFGFLSASAGFVVGLRTPDDRPPPRRTGRSRTAILMPTYNEDPGLVLAAVQSMAEEVRHAGMARECDFFILSDTRDEAIASTELAGCLRARTRLQAGPQLYYRRRQENTDRKAGNIADWVQTFGGAYDYMLVLDADSLMSGAAIAELVGGMDEDPGLGLLQTAPAILNGATPFARLQQFANRLYGPVFARGQQWWSGTEGNYWGHNALIRVSAFAACARLPHLPGRRPFGGHILSHDFVEAALLRRAGWAVRTLACLPGSYEEGPPTLLDAAARDRRWCQGNLQHARVLGAAGLHWVSRMHLVCGIMSYLAPVLWLAALVTGALVWPAEHIEVGAQAFHEVTALAAMGLGLLIAPKLMALVLALRARETRRGFGGGPRLVAGVLAETLASLLTTPVTMVMQSVSVFQVLFGQDSGWSAQDRQGVELSHRQAWRAHRVHVVAGFVGAAMAGALSTTLLMWTSPVFLSLTLSALISALSSRPWREDERWRLFQTPEELSPPPVLARALVLRQAYGVATPRAEGRLGYTVTLYPSPAGAGRGQLALVA